MASKKQDLHSILEGMNVAHRKDMKDVIVGHLNENGILKKEWDLPKSDQIKPKWSTSMRKPLRRYASFRKFMVRKQAFLFEFCIFDKCHYCK